MSENPTSPVENPTPPPAAQAAKPPAEAAEKPPAQSWRYFISLIRYSPWLYLGIVAMRLFIFAVVPQLLGLATREFFNTLSGEPTWGLSPEAIAALTVGFAVARAFIIVADMFAHNLYTFRTGALLRKNLLTRILERPGRAPCRSRPARRSAASATMWTTPGSSPPNCPLLSDRRCLPSWRCSPCCASACA